MDKMKLSVQKDVTYGYSWPQRNFTCSFCKKEYKSAQALGGHMNVHRRDRAKLMRELSPSLYGLNSNTNPSPTPNPNPCFSSPSSVDIKVSSDSNPIMNSDISSSKLVKYFSYGKPLIPCYDVSFEEEKKNLKKKREEEFRVLKKRKNFSKMDSGVELIREDKQELDLELRLGFS